MEEFFDCEKLNFFTAEKTVSLMTLKANANAETIKKYILNLEQKVSSLTFLGVGKINIMCIKRPNHKH